MIARILPLFVLVALFSCSSLPKINRVNRQEMLAIQKRCSLPYTTEGTQFIHSIEAAMPGNSTHFMTGITSVFSEEEKLESVLLTIEGLVLFHAVYDKEGLHVKRAVPPFDLKGFAKGLLDDIQLIFLKPGGIFIESGKLKNGKSICRFKRDDDSVVDVEIDQDNNWKIVLFDSGFNQQRTIEARFNGGKNISSGKPVFPTTIHLQSHNMIGYSLNMKLIRAERQNR